MATRVTSSHHKQHGWPLHVVFTESADATRADIVMDVGGHHYHAWGRARRNPSDPDIPRIGEEIAAARALNGLALQLLRTAGQDIAGFEGHPVSLHV
jgi:hypothetical protein